MKKRKKINKKKSQNGGASDPQIDVGNDIRRFIPDVRRGAEGEHAMPPFICGMPKEPESCRSCRMTNELLLLPSTAALSWQVEVVFITWWKTQRLMNNGRSFLYRFNPLYRITPTHKCARSHSHKGGSQGMRYHTMGEKYDHNVNFQHSYRQSKLRFVRGK